jgi:hypothetical protein
MNRLHVSQLTICGDERPQKRTFVSRGNLGDVEARGESVTVGSSSGSHQGGQDDGDGAHGGEGEDL